MSLRHAATVCVVRPAADTFEVLLGKRGEGAAFVGGAYVFPGGAVDPIDLERAGETGDPGAYAAVRETFEEMAIALTHAVAAHPDYQSMEFSEVAAGTDPGILTYLSTWVTPAFLPIRFDTRFYLSVVAADTVALMDGYEFVDAAWVTPQAALGNVESGAWICVSPTIAHLQYLSAFASMVELREGLATQAHLERVDQSLIEGQRPEGLSPLGSNP